MTHGPAKEVHLVGLRCNLEDPAWRQRQAAVDELLAHGKANPEAALETVEAVLPVFQSHKPWRARAAALRVLKGCDQEVHLKTLEKLVVKDQNAQPSDVGADPLAEGASDEAQPADEEREGDGILNEVQLESETSMAPTEGSREVGHEEVEDENADRVVADIPIPVQLSGNRHQDGDDASIASSFNFLSDSEESAETPQPRLPPSAEPLLWAMAARVEAGDSDLAVYDQLRVAKMARLAFEGEVAAVTGEDAKMQVMALKLLADFGGSQDLHQLLKVAAKSQRPDVRQAAAVAATRITGRHPGKANVQATARLFLQLFDDEDALVRREAVGGLAGIDMRSLNAPRLSLLCPLLRALSDEDVATRRLAAQGLMEKAKQLIQLPQTVWHGYGQQAGVGLAAIRTASGDEVEALLLHVFQESRDWWCFRAAVTLALSLSGNVKNKAWEVLLDRLSFSSGSAIAKGVGDLNDDLRCTVSVRLGIPQPAILDRERTEDALKHLESGWWRLRTQATQVLIQAVQSGCYEAGMGVVKKLSHTSSRVRLAAVGILSHISMCMPDVLLRTTEGLLVRLSDPVADVREAAHATIIRIATNGVFDDQALRAVLRPLLQGPSAEERRVCSQVLLNIAEVEVHGPRLAMMICGIIVRALVTSDVNGSDAKNVALSLLAQTAPCKHPAATAMLTQLIKTDDDPSVRLAALDALQAVAGVGSRHLKEAALHLVLDEDDVVRDAAAEILEHLDLTEEEDALPGDLDLPVIEQESLGKNIAEEPQGSTQQPEQGTSESQDIGEMGQRLLGLAEQFQSLQSLDLSDQGKQMEQVLQSQDQEALRQWLHEIFPQLEGMLTPGPKYPMGVYLDELRVMEIFEGSPAEKAGILIGDILQKVNGVEITTQEELRKELDVAGDKCLLVERAGGEVEVMIHLGGEHQLMQEVVVSAGTNLPDIADIC